MICAYCDAVIPDGAEVCPECGKPVDETGLGGTLKFFDMKSSVRVTGIECLIIPVLVMAAILWEFRRFFRYGFSFSRIGLIEIVLAAVFAAGIVFIIIGIIHLINAGKCFFSIKNHGVKAAYPTVFGTVKYLESRYEDISYAYIAKTGKYSILKIGTPGGEHKIRGLNTPEEQNISSHINTAKSTPADE